MTIPLWQKIARFAVVGGTATLTHLGMALLLHYQFDLAALLANVIAFFTAWSVSYLGNWAWTFGAVAEHKTSVPRFIAVSIGCFGLNQGLLWLLHSVAELPLWLALLPVVLIVPATSFAASALWAFAAPARLGTVRS
ncbi:MAG: GtrA family protein [Pseudomonadota bacterium]